MGMVIELDVLIGTLENTTDQGSGRPIIRGAAVGRWGLDEAGNAYYDPAGASDGEHALLSISAGGEPVLTSAVATVSVDAGPDGRRFAGTRTAPERAYARGDDGRLFGGPLLVERRQPERRADGRAFGRGRLQPRTPRQYDCGRSSRLVGKATRS